MENDKNRHRLESQFVAETAGLPNVPEESNLDAMVRGAYGGDCSPETVRKMTAPFVALIKRLQEENARHVKAQNDLIAQFDKLRRITMAALNKIADHQTQLPWGECARIAREAIAHYQS
jgi:hypothetical protein